MIAYSGKKTGRSPADKRVVDEPEIRDDVWWGNVNMKLPQLSMGMTQDFPIGIDEGATLVRVGTAIFGERRARKGDP